MQAVVHVCDPGQPGKTQDFTCNIRTLMQGMRYFHDVLQKATQNRISPVEISVHCDVAVFEWLLGYCCGKTTRDHITIDRALPLLIASNFLQMDALVSDCLAYMAVHLLQVAQHQHERVSPGGDLAALPLDLLSRLAKLVPERSLEQLAAVRSAEGRTSHMPLVNRLYKYKLEGCLRELKTTLARCAVCQCLFSLADRAKLECQGPPLPNAHHPHGGGRAARGKAAEGGAGRAMGAQAHAQRRPGGGSSGSVHIPDAAWRLQDHLAALRTQNIPWRGIFWHVWGLVHVVYCHSCMQHLPAAALHRCTYHPQAPVFAAAPPPATSGSTGASGPRPAATGFYPCCGAAASRGIDPRVSAATGCCTRDHRVLPAGHPPGAPLPAGLTPALLDTLQSCAGLFTNSGGLLLREENCPVTAAAAGATGASANGGGGALMGREGPFEERASSSNGLIVSPRRLRKLASYNSYDSSAVESFLEASDGKLIPPALQALLSSTAAAAAAARGDISGVGGGSGSGGGIMKSSSSGGPGIAGLMASGSLGPAAAATAAALGYRLNNFPSVDQPGTSGPGPPHPPPLPLPLASQPSIQPISSSQSSSQHQPPSRQHQHQQQPVRPVSSPQRRQAGAGTDHPSSGTSISLQPSLSLTGNPLLLDARSLAAEVVRRLSQGGSGVSGASGGPESATAPAAADSSLQHPSVAAQAPYSPSITVTSNGCNSATGSRNSFGHGVEYGQQQHPQQGKQHLKQQGQGQGHLQQQRDQARRSFTSLAALQQEAFDQALVAEAEEMAAVRSEGAPGAGWSVGRSGAGSPLSLFSSGAGGGTPVVLSPPPYTPQQAGTSRRAHPHPLSSPQPPQPPPQSPHVRLLSSVQSSPHSPYQQQSTQPHSPLRPAAATARGALVSRAGVRSAGSAPPAASATAAAAPPAQPPASPPFPSRPLHSTSQEALGLSGPNSNESQPGFRTEPPPDHAMQGVVGAGEPAATCPQFLTSSTSIGGGGGSGGGGGGGAGTGSSTVGGQQWAGPHLALSALSAEAVLLAAGRMSRVDSQLRASAPLPHHGATSSSSGRREVAEQPLPPPPQQQQQQFGYHADTSSSYEQQQQLYPSPRSQPSPMQSPGAETVGAGNASRPSSHTSSPYQHQHQHNHNHHQHHTPTRHQHRQQNRQHFHSHQPQPASEQLPAEHVRTSHQRPTSHQGASGPSGSTRRDSALPPRPAHRAVGSNTSGGRLRRRPSEAGGQRGGGGGDASLQGSDTDLGWPVGCSVDGLGGAGSGGGGESRAAGRGSREASPQTGMAAAAGPSSGRSGVRWSQASMVSASSDGNGSGGMGPGNPLQRSVQAALLQQRQKRQAEPPQNHTSSHHHHQHMREASPPPSQHHQQRSRQRSAGRAHGQAPSGQADVRRSSGSIGSEAADPAAAAATTDPTRQALIEQYKTQRVLSPRPSNVQMIAISELPAGGRGASSGGFRPGEVPGGGARGGGRGEGSASMSNIMPYKAGVGQPQPYKAGGSYSSGTQWLRQGHRGSDGGGASGPVGSGRFLTSSTAPAAVSDAGDASMFSAGLDEVDDGCGGSGYGAANSTAGGLAMSPANRGRKLRMELLHEDDNYRMDLLVQHLLACRPSTRGSLGTKDRETRRGRPAAAPGRQNTTRGGTGDKPGSSRPTSAAASVPPRQQRQRSQSVSNLQRLISVYGTPPSGSVHSRGAYGPGGLPHTARTQSPTLQGEVAYSGWQDGGSFGRAGEVERGYPWGRSDSGLVDSQAGAGGSRDAHGGRRQELRPLSAPRMRRYA